MMRDVMVGDEVFHIRGLTRGEIKSLRAEGVNLMALTVNDADKAFDLVVAMVFDSAAVAWIDSQENRVGMKLWEAVLKETFGAEDEEKNLSRSGNGTQTENE